MCFSPQRRAIFRHHNFKKRSETVSFLAFWLVKVLFATAACNFSTSELQKVLRDRQFFFTFWLVNVLFATAACNFSTSELQQVVRDRQFSNILTSKFVFRHSGVQFFDIRTSKSTPRPSFFFNILTSKGVFRHSGVQFLISLLSTYLCTRRFDRPTFRLSRHTNHGKTQHSRLL